MGWWGVVGNRRIYVMCSVTLRCANRCKYVQPIATRNALSVLPRAFEARRTGLEPATTGSTGRYRGIARSAAATACGLGENRVTRSVTLRRRNRLPARPDRNCVAGAIGCHEGRHRGDGCCQYGNSNPTITNCTISNNYANYGGGISSYNNSNPTISGCTITDNTAYDTGGGIHCIQGSNPTISGCTIMGNALVSVNTSSGGGIYCNYSNPTITDCVISGNTAIFRGGGIACILSSPTITGCTISENTANNIGGGIYCSSSSSPTLTDTVVCGNDPDQIYPVDGWTDNGGNTVSDECPPDCPDVDGDGMVGVNDVLAVVAAWGSDDPDADVNGDGIVGTDDLLAVIGAWGPCE